MGVLGVCEALCFEISNVGDETEEVRSWGECRLTQKLIDSNVRDKNLFFIRSRAVSLYYKKVYKHEATKMTKSGHMVQMMKGSYPIGKPE